MSLLFELNKRAAFCPHVFFPIPERAALCSFYLSPTGGQHFAFICGNRRSPHRNKERFRESTESDCLFASSLARDKTLAGNV